MKPQFVSYPKSGRSWIRFTLSIAGQDRAIAFHHDGFEFNDGKRPPHDFSVSNRLLRYKEADRVIYLERDPRDVMVSLYHQITGRFADMFDYMGDISEFIRHEYFGAETLRRFRDMWHTIVAQRGYLRITYEACHDDMHAVLRNILDYCSLRVPDARLSEAIAAGSFENMRKIEQCGSFEQPWLRLRNGAPKVRMGRVGNFRQVLNEDDVAYLNRIFEFSA